MVQYLSFRLLGVGVSIFKIAIHHVWNTTKKPGLTKPDSAYSLPKALVMFYYTPNRIHGLQRDSD